MDKKYQTLADALGLNTPPEHRESPILNPRLTRRDYARAVLTSPEYRQSVIDRIKLGTLPPNVECLLYHYAYGKPTEHVEVKDTTNRFEGMSIESMETRASQLIERAKQLRRMQEPDAAPKESVH